MKYILLLVLGLSITLGSCLKFLEETPTGSLTDQSTVTSYAGGLALATGAYRSLPNWTNGAQWWGGNLANAMEYATGKAFSQYQAADLYKYENGSETGDSEYFIAPWNNWYRGVRDCNLAIQMIPNVSGFSAADKLRYLGEVRTLRAFYYFCLVRHYGDVIYNTAILTDITQAAKPRVSLKTIYDKIILPDLEFAVNESGLPSGQSTDGRVTLDVARVILADVYMNMAGYPYQEVNTSGDTTKCLTGNWTETAYPVVNASASGFFQKAQTQLNALWGQYPLGEYSDLRMPEMNNKGGFIWEVQYLSGTYNNGIVQTLLPLASQISQNDENGTGIPSVEYYASYATNDIRQHERVFFFSSDNISTKYDPNEGPASKFPMNFLYKHYDTKAIKVGGGSGLNWSLYRYADVCLMLTEVNYALRANAVSVSDADITKGINLVRAKAGLSTFTSGIPSLLDIMSERAYELIWENKMLWDMRRTRTCLVGYQPPHFLTSFSVRDLLCPVASTELDNNRECLQNFGWSPRQLGQGN
jgi:hypothetical protein